MSTKKVTITLEEKVIGNIDSYADKIGISRSAAVTLLVSQGLQMAYYPELLEYLIEIDKESKKK